MTTCVAAICDNGDAIILVADKMIGTGYIESELDITKIRSIHKDWWMLFAGDDFDSHIRYRGLRQEWIRSKQASLYW